MSGFLLSVLFRSAVLGLLGLVALWLLRGRSASVRHALAAGTLVAMLAVPVLSMTLKPREVGMLPVVVTAPLAPIVQPPSVAVRMATGARPWSPVPAVAEPDRRYVAGVLLAGVWAMGASLLFTRILVGIGLLAGRVRRGRRELLAGSGVAVFTDAHTPVPMTAWLGRHVVLLPSAWTAWPTERLDTVLRHERAHVRRGDWFTQLAGQLACALLWPNPLVWVLSRRARDLSEQATDDLVLSSGVAPSRYAQDLLEIARETKTTFPALALPMAEKAEVVRRIEMVLNNKKRRGAITLPGIVAASLVLAGVSVPLASWVIGPRIERFSGNSIVTTGSARQSDPFALPPGGEAGDASNGFVGKIPDGRTVELVQVARRLADGTVQVWGPDGTPLPRERQIPVDLKGANPNVLQFAVRLQSPAKGEIHGGIGSGPHDPGDPLRQTFSYSCELKPDAEGRRVVLSHVEIEKLGSHGLASYSFGFADGPYRNLWTLTPDGSQSSHAGSDNPVSDAEVRPNATAPDEKKSAAHQVRYRVDSSAWGTHIEAVGHTRDGRELRSLWNDGMGDHPRSFIPKDPALKTIEVRSKPTHRTLFLGVHLRPSGVPIR